jgi:hypothetical protein
MQGEASAVLVPRRKQKMTDCFRLPGAEATAPLRPSSPSRPGEISGYRRLQNSNFHRGLD